MPASAARPSATARRSSFSTGELCAVGCECHAPADSRALGSARVTRAGERVLAIANFAESAQDSRGDQTLREVRFGATPKPDTRDACATQSDLPPETAASTIAAMLDIRLIREKTDFVRERLATRGGGDEIKIAEVLR